MNGYFSPGGGGGGWRNFWGITWLYMGTEGGEGGTSNEKGDYRELTANWGIR